MKVIRMNNLEESCPACPTIFEFDSEGNHYYFRYRWGGWKLVNQTTDEIIASGYGTGDDYDGFCSIDDMIRWCFKAGIWLKKGKNK